MRKRTDAGGTLTPLRRFVTLRKRFIPPHTFLSSSMAEHSAVNRRVVGSSPTSGAKFFQVFRVATAPFPDNHHDRSGRSINKLRRQPIVLQRDLTRASMKSPT